MVDKESKIMEFKERYTKTLLKTVCAYANYNGGRILIGVDDAGKVIGVQEPKDLLMQVENAINESIDPRPDYAIELKVMEDKLVVELSIFPGDSMPYMWKNKTYKRYDTSTVEVDRTEMKRLILNGMNKSYDETECELNGTFIYLERKLKSKLNIKEMTQDVLTTLGLLNKGQYNVAGALLSDENPVDYAYIELIAYADDSVMTIVDHNQLKGISLLEQVDKCIDFYHKHINREERIESICRETVERVPLVAYRESILNAVIHRDYLSRSFVRVEVFSDRIEIVSPGGLPIGMKKADFVSGRYMIIRNELIAGIFHRLGYIEKLGTGIRRIKGSYKQYEVSPSFDVSENSICTVLPNVDNALFKGEASVHNEVSNSNKSEQMDQIVEFAKENNVFKRSDIEILLGLKKSRTASLLQDMVEDGRLIKAGQGKGSRYILNI